MTNRWDAMCVREYETQGQTKSAWTKVGSGFTNKDGSISVLLDAIPINGRIVLQVPLTKEQWDARKTGGQAPQHPRSNDRGGAQQPLGRGNQQRFGQQRPPSQPRQGNFAPPQPTVQYEPEFEPGPDNDPEIPF